VWGEGVSCQEEGLFCLRVWKIKKDKAFLLAMEEHTWQGKQEEIEYCT